MRKVFFINNGTTHYYNLVLNRLSREANIDLTVIVPDRVSSNIGEGVYQTRDGITFRIVELREYALFGRFSTFQTLWRFLATEKPDVVIFADTYLFSFVLNVPVVLVVKLLGIKLIMKSIPFRLPSYDEAREKLRSKKAAQRVLGRIILSLRRFAYKVPDAHVNYVDNAFSVYGSYGVPRSRIFITRNSPDTDSLLQTRASIGTDYERKPHRLIHVGRLVPWKRVDMLIRAFARIRQMFSDADLLVIGNGPERDRLEALAGELGVGEQVLFLGGVYDPHVLSRHLLSSSVYVLAGMGGLSINEAMCFGLPIICSVGDGTEKFLVRDGVNGRYFRDGDEDDLVEKIAYLFQKPELMKEMGLRSEQIIRHEVNIRTVIAGYGKAIDYVLGGTAQAGSMQTGVKKGTP